MLRKATSSPFCCSRTSCAIKRSRRSMSNRCRSRRMSLASLKGVSSRLANSSPSIGTMLMVGFSATLPPKMAPTTAQRLR